LSGELTALPQASWLDSVEGRRRGEIEGKGRGKKVGGEKEDKGRKEMGRGQRERKGTREVKGRNFVQLRFFLRRILRPPSTLCGWYKYEFINKSRIADGRHLQTH